MTFRPLRHLINCLVALMEAIDGRQCQADPGLAVLALETMAAGLYDLMSTEPAAVAPHQERLHRLLVAAANARDLAHLWPVVNAFRQELRIIEAKCASSAETLGETMRQIKFDN